MMNHQYDEAPDGDRREANGIHLESLYSDMNHDKGSAGLTSSKLDILSRAP